MTTTSLQAELGCSCLLELDDAGLPLETLPVVYEDAEVVALWMDAPPELIAKAAVERAAVELQIAKQVKSHLERHGKWERRVAQALHRVMQRMARDVARRIRDFESLEPTRILPKGKWWRAARQAVQNALYAAAIESARETLRRANHARLRKQAIQGGDLSWSDAGQVLIQVPPEAKAAITAGIDEALDQDYWQQWETNTRTMVGQKVNSGINAGLNLLQIADTMDEAWPFSYRRAMLVARTEVNGAMNFGHHAINQALVDDPRSIVNGRSWISIIDKDTRGTHRAANGQRVVKLANGAWLVQDESKQQIGTGPLFMIGSERARFPGDPNLSAGERINCRCTQLDVFEGELGSIPPDSETITDVSALPEEQTSVIPTLSDEATSWKASLTNTERAGMESWEGHFENVYNYRAIEANKPLLHADYSEREINFIRTQHAAFRSAVDKAPNIKGTAYRGMVGVDEGSLQVGGTMEFDAHASASLSRAEASKYASFDINPATGDKILKGNRVIVELDGDFADIRATALRADAKNEVLVRPGQAFEITSKQQKTFIVDGKQYECTYIKVRQVRGPTRPAVRATETTKPPAFTIPNDLQGSHNLGKRVVYAANEHPELEATRLRMIKAAEEHLAEVGKLEETLASVRTQLDVLSNKVDDARKRIARELGIEDWWGSATASHTEVKQGQREISKLYKQHDATTKAIKDAKKKSRQAAVKQLHLPESDRIKLNLRDGYNEVKVTKRQREKIEEGAQYVADMIPKTDTHATLHLRHNTHKKGKGAWHDSDGIHIENGEPIKIIAHETGHEVEEVIGNGKDVARWFQRERIKSAGKPDINFKEKFGWKRRGADMEIGNDDHFGRYFKNKADAAYCGKRYSTGHTEVVSMGLQAMYENPVKFAQADPEYFKFILGFVRRTFETL